MSNQRQHDRVSLAVDFKAHDALGSGTLVFTSADLSPGGAFLKSELLLELGEALALEFKLPGAKGAMRAQARVAWVRRFPGGGETPGMGMEFTTIDADDRDRLVAFLSSR